MTLKMLNKNAASFIKKYTQFLREDSHYSTMRMVTTVMITTGCFYVIFQTLLKLPIDWFGVSGWATVALGGKMLQKKDEVKEYIEETRNSNEAVYRNEESEYESEHQSNKYHRKKPPIDPSMDPA